MLSVTMEKDDFGGLACTLVDGETRGIARASNIEQAAAGLLNALDDVEADGTGECFWPRESGVYRWLIRRQQEGVQLVVLWSAGTLTGWENVFWTTCEWAPAASAIRSEVMRAGYGMGSQRGPGGAISSMAASAGFP